MISLASAIMKIQETTDVPTDAMPYLDIPYIHVIRERKQAPLLKHQTLMFVNMLNIQLHVNGLHDKVKEFENN